MNTQPEQRTPEWCNQRIGMITASRAGAALGLSPFQTPDELIRAMVREYHHAESEFTGNAATAYGAAIEPTALLDFEQSHGVTVKPCGFFVSPDNPIIGASPDGLIGEHGVLEIKAPFGLRNKSREELKFKTLAEQPHYYAQIQIQLYATRREIGNFFQYAPSGSTCELVLIDRPWLDEALPKLVAFHARYMDERDNAAHLLPLRKDVGHSDDAQSLIDEYDALSGKEKYCAERKKAILAELVCVAGGKDATINGRKLTLVERKGSIDYSQIPALIGIDLEQWRKAGSSFWKLS